MNAKKIVTERYEELKKLANEFENKTDNRSKAKLMEICKLIWLHESILGIKRLQ